MRTPDIRNSITRNELIDIQSRRRGDKDVKRLLANIHQLRQIALRADQICSIVGNEPVAASSYMGPLLEAMRELLDAENVVVAHRESKAVMLLRRRP